MLPTTSVLMTINTIKIMIVTAIVLLVITHLSIYLSSLKIEIVDSSFAVRFLLCEGQDCFLVLLLLLPPLWRCSWISFDRR